MRRTENGDALPSSTFVAIRNLCPSALTVVGEYPAMTSAVAGGSETGLLGSQIQSWRRSKQTPPSFWNPAIDRTTLCRPFATEAPAHLRLIPAISRFHWEREQHRLPCCPTHSRSTPPIGHREKIVRSSPPTPNQRLHLWGAIIPNRGCADVRSGATPSCGVPAFSCTMV